MTTCAAIATASDRAGVLGALSRVMRLVLQSLVLGLGAYLVINQEATAGVIIASSILVSRALAPVELAIANWKGFVAARQARMRLTELSLCCPGKQPLPLPKPEVSLSVESVSASPTRRWTGRVCRMSPSHSRAAMVLASSVRVPPGNRRLARLLVGVWQPVRGNVRLDGAALDQWSPDALGRHIGYLPQDVELFDGTIAENISRFEAEPDADAIIAAAKSAGVHELVARLPEGYDTRIGEAGAALSAGQRQSVALARALYRDPFLVVLDEPNSNLDSEGEEALTRQFSAFVPAAVSRHRRPSRKRARAVDQVLVLNQGRQQVFGPETRCCNRCFGRLRRLRCHRGQQARSSNA